MKRILRFLKQLMIGLSIIVVLVLATIYFLSERLLRRMYDVEGAAVTVPTDAASITEGLRLATLRGCYGGCHGSGFGGEVFLDEPFPMNVLIGRWLTPDLTALAEARTDAELERSIRHGVNAEGRSVLAMPSEMLAYLSDEDLGRILASLRAEPPAHGAPASRRLGPLVRFLLLRGEFEPAAAMIDHSVTPPTRTPTAPLTLGEYLAMTACTECHGLDLMGSPAAGPAPAFPPLAVVAGYTRGQFGRLMKEGVPASELELDLMKDVALGRFANFTEAEVTALFTYLNAAATWERSGGGGSE